RPTTTTTSSTPTSGTTSTTTTSKPTISTTSTMRPPITTSTTQSPNETGRFTSGRVLDDPARNPAATIRFKTVRTSGRLRGAGTCPGGERARPGGRLRGDHRIGHGPLGTLLRRRPRVRARLGRRGGGRGLRAPRGRLRAPHARRPSPAGRGGDRADGIP